MLLIFVINTLSAILLFVILSTFFLNPLSWILFPWFFIHQYFLLQHLPCNHNQWQHICYRLTFYPQSAILGIFSSRSAILNTFSWFIILQYFIFQYLAYNHSQWHNIFHWLTLFPLSAILKFSLIRYLEYFFLDLFSSNTLSSNTYLIIIPSDTTYDMD